MNTILEHMHYWQRSTITRWWTADILCCIAIFFAVFMIALNLMQPHDAQQSLIVPPNSYQNVKAQSTKKKRATPTFHKVHSVKVDRGSKVHKEIFTLQAEGHWKDADKLISSLDKSDSLKGHILAQRYLHKDYISKPAELKEWLKKYHDHPQAARIYQLASRKGAENIKQPSAQRKLNGSGYSQPTVRKTFVTWKTGLQQWKKHNYSEAYKQFAQFTADDTTKIKHWDRAAGHFWAYRAALKLNDKKLAYNHLMKAAKHPGSFYGAQANHVLGKNLVSDDSKYNTQNTNSLKNFPAAIRAGELVAAGQHNLAAQEIRYGYYRATDEQRYALIALSEKLSLPAVQIRLADQLYHRRNKQMLNRALYPTPGWQPHAGYAVDPALIFAIARQESGFDSSAKSYAGAQGIMQIMPRTANYILKRIDPKLQQITDAQAPSYSQGLTLGQTYLRYLLEKPYINNNLVYLAIAYNAGAANLLKWKKELPKSDPLLFIESIPYKETRDYVLNVLANYWIYQDIMGADGKHKIRLATGQWPMYQSTEKQVADAVAFLSE